MPQIHPHNAVPAIKDRIVNAVLDVSAFPGPSQRILFMNLMYDYQVVGISALVSVVTTAAASPFTLGIGAYTDRHGNIIPAVNNQFLTLANCLDKNGQSFSTQILPLGSLHFFPIQPDPLGQGLNILPAGAPLIVVGSNTANTGEAILNVILRPKDKDRGDSARRPGGAADEAFATYYK